MDSKADNATDDAEAALWGGALMGDNRVQWAPTSGRGKKKEDARGQVSQPHFFQPPVSKIKVDIKQEGVKWRTSSINGGSGVELGDPTVGRTKILPWVVPVKDQGINQMDMEMTDVDDASVAGNAGGHTTIGTAPSLS